MARNLAQRVHNVSDRIVVVRRSLPELGLSVKRPGKMAERFRLGYKAETGHDTDPWRDPHVLASFGDAWRRFIPLQAGGSIRVDTDGIARRTGDREVVRAAEQVIAGSRRPAASLADMVNCVSNRWKFSSSWPSSSRFVRLRDSQRARRVLPEIGHGGNGDRRVSGVLSRRRPRRRWRR
jgi:hypothetical protein